MLSELIEPYICAREINIVHAIVHCYRNQQREYLYLFSRLFSFVHCYCLCEYNWNRMHFDRNWNLNHVCIRRSDARPKHIYIYWKAKWISEFPIYHSAVCCCLSLSLIGLSLQWHIIPCHPTALCRKRSNICNNMQCIFAPPPDCCFCDISDKPPYRSRFSMHNSTDTHTVHSVLCCMTEWHSCIYYKICKIE